MDFETAMQKESVERKALVYFSSSRVTFCSTILLHFFFKHSTHYFFFFLSSFPIAHNYMRTTLAKSGHYCA